MITKYSYEPLIEEKDGALVVTAGHCVEPARMLRPCRSGVHAPDGSALQWGPLPLW